ncbi:MAG TPA: hypothetical protein VNM37_12130, partial [Candidatus Dormibacteraeota bacterium]|nr:hypothetical protein [Candidatus Dormibacteraeota bacterium]
MSYPGGKNGAGVYQRIISMMPPHQVYIEPFLGGGAIARLKRPAPVNIAMDLYAPAVENFRKLLASSDPPSRYLTGSAETTGNGDEDRNASSSGADVAIATIADTTRLGDARSLNAKSGERPRRAPSSATPKWTVLQEDGLKFLEASP